jgi:hypothetical protein
MQRFKSIEQAQNFRAAHTIIERHFPSMATPMPIIDY